MKYKTFKGGIFTAFFLSIILTLQACSDRETGASILVENAAQLEQAIAEAEPGDEIVMRNGSWQDLQIRFEAEGEKGRPILLRAETPGGVKIEGQSDLKLSGQFLEVSGLHFQNGYSPSSAVISFRIDPERIAENCKVSQVAITGYTQKERFKQDHWVEFHGRFNTLENSSLVGKSNRGPTIRAFLKGNQNINTHHQIKNNHFGPRPRKGGPRGETMQLGASSTSMTPAYINVEGNFFERCNGEVEVISSKSNFNTFKNNVFYQCEGSLVLRHGNYATVDGNLFIGDPKSDNVGGIRVINTGHWITNNYFVGLRGKEFRSPLAIMNGIPKSPLNRYNQVTDVVVAYNSWFDCQTPWQFSVGVNTDKSDVLPKQEIRSARPERVLLANNVIYQGAQNVSAPIKAYDTIDGARFYNNVLVREASTSSPKDERLRTMEGQAAKLSPWYMEFASLALKDLEAYQGYGFDRIETDLFGQKRKGLKGIGAVVKSPKDDLININPEGYGVAWKQALKRSDTVKTFELNTVEELYLALEDLAPKKEILLNPGEYFLSRPLVLSQNVSLRSNNPEQAAVLKAADSVQSAMIKIGPGARIEFEALDIRGNKGQAAISTLESGMSKNYDLFVSGGSIENFSALLEVSKGSFADTISFDGVRMSQLSTGLRLNKETEDKGEYNAEFVIIENCTIQAVESDLIDFYRGGYDESTIGGNLIFANNKVSGSGGKDAEGILIKSHGIVNVALENNDFVNNRVKHVAILWGEKNNHHNGNRLEASGKITVQQNLKQKLMY